MPNFPCLELADKATALASAGIFRVALNYVFSEFRVGLGKLTAVTIAADEIVFELNQDIGLQYQGYFVTGLQSPVGSTNLPR